MKRKHHRSSQGGLRNRKQPDRRAVESGSTVSEHLEPRVLLAGDIYTVELGPTTYNATTMTNVTGPGLVVKVNGATGVATTALTFSPFRYSSGSRTQAVVAPNGDVIIAAPASFGYGGAITTESITRYNLQTTPVTSSVLDASVATDSPNVAVNAAGDIFTVEQGATTYNSSTMITTTAPGSVLKISGKTGAETTVLTLPAGVYGLGRQTKVAIAPDGKLVIAAPASFSCGTTLTESITRYDLTATPVSSSVLDASVATGSPNIALDAQGDIYTVEQGATTYNSSTFTFTTAPGTVLRIDAKTAAVTTALTLPSGAYGTGKQTQVAVTTSGKLVIAAPASFPCGTTLTESITRYDLSTTPVSSSLLDASLTSDSPNVAVSAKGDVYTVEEGATTYDASTFTNVTGPGSLVKINGSTGAVTTALTFSGNRYSTGSRTQVVVAPNGNLIVAAPASFSCGTALTESITRYDLTTTPVTSSMLDASIATDSPNVAVDPQGDVYTIEQGSTSYNASTQTYTTTPGSVLKIDAITGAETTVFTLPTGASGTGSQTRIAIAPDGKLIVAAPASFACGTLVATESITRYDLQTTPVTSTVLAASVATDSPNVAVNARGDIYTVEEGASTYNATTQTYTRAPGSVLKFDAATGAMSTALTLPTGAYGTGSRTKVAVTADGKLIVAAPAAFSYASNLPTESITRYDLQTTPVTSSVLEASVPTDSPNVAVPETPLNLVFLSQPANKNAGAPLSSVQVAIEDSAGDIIKTDTSNVTLTLLTGVFSTGGSTASVSAVAGVATFSNLTINSIGSYKLVASDGVDTAGTSAGFSTIPIQVGAFGTQSGRHTKLVLSSSSGSPVTLTLGGPGSAQVTKDGVGNLQINVSGSTRGTSIHVTSVSTFTVQNITISGAIGSITAPSLSLTGNLIVNGPASSITLGTVSSNGSVTVAALNTLVVKQTMAGNLQDAGFLKVARIGAGLSGGTWSVGAGTTSLTAGAVASTWAANFVGKLSTVSVLHDFDGLIAAASIGTLTVRGNLNGATILAGANLGPLATLAGNDNSFFAGFIKSVVVKGSMLNSLVAAGLKPTGNTFLSSGTTLIAGGMIGAVQIAGNADANSHVLASVLPKALKIGGIKVLTSTHPAIDALPGSSST